MPQPPAYEQEQSDEIRRRGSLVLQTLPIMLIPIGVALTALLLVRPFVALPHGEPLPPSPAVPILVLVVFFSALILLVRLRRPTVSALVLIAAWTMITAGAMLRTGVSSIAVALLVVPICVAGLLIDAVASISLAALATVLVLCLSWLEGQGMLLGAPVPPEPVLTGASGAVVFWIGLFWTVAALTSLLAGGQQRALRESRQRAAELRLLSDELEARVQLQTRELLAQAQERATLEERARLAREIHDTLAQGLAGAAVQIGAARQGLALLNGADSALRAELDEHLRLAEGVTRETLAEARRSVWNLRAPLLERGGLRDALERIGAQSPLEVALLTEGEPWPLAPAVEAALLRVAQEALANATKQPAARRATVTLRYEAAAVELRVADDGPGFPPALLARRPQPGPRGGFGLLGMEERIAALGGALRLANDGGAVVTVRVPRG